MLGTPRRTIDRRGRSARPGNDPAPRLPQPLPQQRQERERQRDRSFAAKVFIPKGTTALALAKKGLFESTSIPKDQLKEGAVTDAAVIQGQVALNDIYPGQQLTATDFGVTATSSALSGSADLLGAGRTTGTWRALAINLDAISRHHPADADRRPRRRLRPTGGKIGLLMQNVLVLQAPNQAAIGHDARRPRQLTSCGFRRSSQRRFAFAADNGSIWFALRPQKFCEARRLRVRHQPQPLPDRLNNVGRSPHQSARLARQRHRRGRRARGAAARSRDPDRRLPARSRGELVDAAGNGDRSSRHRLLGLLRACALPDRRHGPGAPGARRSSCFRMSSPDGFLSRLFEMGADDVVRLPESPERVRFTLQKVVARRRATRLAGRRRTRLDDLRARPERRDRQDGDGFEPRGGAGDVR